METTTIQVAEETADELHDRKRRGETYDDVIRRLLEGPDEQPEPSTPAEPEPVDERRREPVQEAAARDVDDLDLPGQGKILVRRREAVQAVVDAIHERPGSTKAELLEVIDVDAIGYGRGGPDSAWKNLIQPALHDLATVEPTGTSGTWVPAG